MAARGGNNSSLNSLAIMQTLKTTSLKLKKNHMNDFLAGLFGEYDSNSICEPWCRRRRHTLVKCIYFTIAQLLLGDYIDTFLQSFPTFTPL